MLKLFSISDFWNRRPLENPGVRIERALLDRSRRLMAGLSVDAKFEFVTGTLVVAKGRGKFNRVLFCDTHREAIPESIQTDLLSLTQSPEPSCNEFQYCVSELANLESTVIEQLKLRASKYVDRILAISVVDPGLWLKDFDGALSYSSLCDANRLAERTGVSVIDAFPDRDLAVGGDGTPLEPLALWLLQADRNSRIAHQINGTIQFANRTTGYLFAPSDGLDASIPIPMTIETEGMDLVEGILTEILSEEIPFREVRKMMVAGTHCPRLVDQWSQSSSLSEMIVAAESSFEKDRSAETLFSTAMHWISTRCEQQIVGGLKRLEQEHARDRQKLVADLEASRGKSRSATSLLAEFDRSKPAFEQPGSILIDGPDHLTDVFVSKIQNRFADSSVATSLERSGETQIATPQNPTSIDQPSLVAALLGLLHIDQMPANIPALTGATQQRILGRLTPGRPNQWRNLLREMADFEPPAMKLRDAV